MKTLRIGFVLGILAATFVAIPTASALHHDTHCEAQIPAGWSHPAGKACVTVNTSDVNLSWSEGLAYVHEDTCNVCEIQFDWVHLYRENNAGDMVLIRYTGSPSGWLSEGQSYSTNWFERQPGQGCRDFYAVARWHTRTGDGTVLGWEKTHSRFYTRLCI